MSAGIDQVVLKIASRCNLNCSYCYLYNRGDDSWRTRSRFISDRVFDRAMEVIRAHCESRGRGLSLLFHGGEPTLIGPARFGELAGRARAVLGEHLVGLGIQTNGMLIDDAWIDAFREHQIQPGVSLDGPQQLHDAVRVDHRGRGSYVATVRGLIRLQQAGLSPGVLTVVNPGHSGLEAYRHIRSLGISGVNFLLPDVSHDDKGRFYAGLGRTPVADFLIPVFDAWFDEDDADVVVGPFWGLMATMMGGEAGSDMFGNPLMRYVVIETDGSIEALDALRVCENGFTRTPLNVLDHGFDDLHLGGPLLYQAVYEGFPLPSACRRCPQQTVCAGGYLPHRYSRARGFDNPSVWCADILELLAHIQERTSLTAHA